MQFLDLIIIFLFVLGFIWGFSKGIIYMFFSLLGIASGIFLGIKIPALIFEFFKFKPVLIYTIISFVIIFSLCYIILINLGSYISELLEDLDIGWIDSFLGGITGILQVAVITGIILILLEKYKLLSFFPDYERSIIPPFLKNTLNELIKFLPVVKH
ncbi:MAG: CvpA family protein [Brevinematia bacterium]